MKKFEKEIREFINMTQNIDETLDTLIKEVENTFKELSNKYYYLKHEKYFSHCVGLRYVYASPDWNVVIRVFNGDIEEIKVGDVTYTPTNIISKNSRQIKILRPSWVVLHPIGYNSIMSPFITLTTSFDEVSTYMSEGCNIVHSVDGNYDVSYLVDEKNLIRAPKRLDKDMNILEECYYVGSTDITNWVKKQNISFPLTDKQQYEFELKYR